MLYKKEITEVNQLTKRFHRDCRRIFAQIREDIQDTTLTKDEIKALVATFGTFSVFVINLIANLRTSHGHLGKPRQLYHSQIRRFPWRSRSCKYYRIIG